MKINKAIREVMRQKGMSLSSMESSLGIIPKKNTKPGNSISARLNSDNLTFNTAVGMLNILGYEIVIQEKRQGNRRTDLMVINQIDDDFQIGNLVKVDSDTLIPEKTEIIKPNTGKKIKLK